jgi:hypothetical protein
MAGNVLIKDDIPGKVILSVEIPYPPTNSVVLIPDEDCFITLRSPFDTELRRDENEALTPPYAKM